VWLDLLLRMLHPEASSRMPTCDDARGSEALMRYAGETTMPDSRSARVFRPIELLSRECAQRFRIEWCISDLVSQALAVRSGVSAGTFFLAAGLAYRTHAAFARSHPEASAADSRALSAACLLVACKLLDPGVRACDVAEAMARSSAVVNTIGFAGLARESKRGRGRDARPRGHDPEPVLAMERWIAVETRGDFRCAPTLYDPEATREQLRLAFVVALTDPPEYVRRVAEAAEEGSRGAEASIRGPRIPFRKIVSL